jgi:hypothetical protein
MCNHGRELTSITLNLANITRNTKNSKNNTTISLDREHASPTGNVASNSIYSSFGSKE